MYDVLFYICGAIAFVCILVAQASFNENHKVGGVIWVTLAVFSIAAWLGMVMLPLDEVPLETASIEKIWVEPSSDGYGQHLAYYRGTTHVLSLDEYATLKVGDPVCFSKRTNTLLRKLHLEKVSQVPCPARTADANQSPSN